MGVKVSTLAKKVEQARMVVGDDPDDVVNIEFRPGAITLGAMDKLAQAAAAASFDPAVFEDLLTPILVKWDLLDDDGTPLPIDRTGLHKLPLEFVGELITVLTTNSEIDEDSGKALDVTLPQTDNSVTSPTGTSSSALPATSA